MKNRLKSLFDPQFLKEMLPLAVPIALQNLLMCSFRLVDTLMIGQLGDASIAAVGLAGQLSFFVELITFGLASGSAVFIAQYHGARNRDGILRAFGATLLFSLPIGLIATGAGFLFPQGVMRIFTNEPALIEEGARYLKVACFSYLGLTLYQPFVIVLRSTEKVRLPMLTSIISAVSNAVLNYIFIFGKLGLPAMGVAGAGLATCISALLNPLLILLISVKERNILIAPLKKLFHLAGFIQEYWLRVLPVVLNEGLWSLSILGVNMVFGRMGADNYAGLTLFRTVENIVFVFFVGICNACNILVGKYVGAGDIQGAKSMAKRFMCLVPVFGIILGTVVLLTRSLVVGLFDVSDAAAAAAMGLLAIYAVEVSLRNVPYLGVVGVFRAGGDTKVGLFIDCFVQYVFVLPVAIVAGLVLRLPFLTTYMLMVGADDLVKCTIVLLHFRSMKWIKPVSGVSLPDPPAEIEAL